MKLRRTYPEDGGYAFGLVLGQVSACKTLLSLAVWKVIFHLEFGSGDPYDWD